MALFSNSARASAHRGPHSAIILTDDAVKAMFKRTNIILTDGVVPVAGKVIGWQQHHATGLLNGIVVNELTGVRYLYGPDLAKGGRGLRLITRLN